MKWIILYVQQLVQRYIPNSVWARTLKWWDFYPCLIMTFLARGLPIRINLCMKDSLDSCLLCRNLWRKSCQYQHVQRERERERYTCTYRETEGAGKSNDKRNECRAAELLGRNRQDIAQISYEPQSRLMECNSLTYVTFSPLIRSSRSRACWPTFTGAAEVTRPIVTVTNSWRRGEGKERENQIALLCVYNDGDEYP